ncbi:hypothetical protein AXA44_02615 [Rhodococcus sp. SC4]|nr:hypothetical protein AXA44_02615 [Rhodococcus sp. SC4]RYE43652.1 MAG: hypothetical protein EOP24_27385 [Hyphomicrobiales bacterium]
MNSGAATGLLVRHAGGEIVYDTTSFRTEDKTGVLLIFADPSQKQLLAAYNGTAWYSAEFVEEVPADGESEDCVEAERTLRSP